jgi:hypothetical protein
MTAWLRRDVLKLLVTVPAACSRRPAARASGDDDLLDEIERASFRYFWDEASPTTGQVKDRALANGNDTRTAASVAATGFGLSALCIADHRGYRPHAELATRALATLRFLAQMPTEHGFYYHFVDMTSGARLWNCELSSIDTALLLAGVLTARQHFTEPQIRELATAIYERVDWPWMLDGGPTLSMGWTPEKGFLASRWEHYCELMMLYLLGYGSPTHPLDAATWHAWKRPTNTYDGITYISSGDPLFTHQYSHAYFDFKGKRDAYADYFENSVKATEAHKRFCLSLRDRYPAYSEDLWGISASDSEHGYTAWGGPPATGPIDGSVVPCAAGGSIPFAFDDCMRVLRTLRGRYGAAVWKKYSFVDAFNPNDGWVNPDVIGIDLGITMVMAENARSGLVWRTFMANPEAQRAMQRAGFH